MRASAPGDAVLVTGCALSETHDGGYAQFARVPGDWVIPLPAGPDPPSRPWRSAPPASRRRFAIHRMEQNGQQPERRPDRRHRRHRRRRQHRHRHAQRARLPGHRRQRQARRRRPTCRRSARTRCCCARSSTSAAGALETARFGGAIDNLGGEVLTWLTRTVDFWGNIASIGLAAGAELKTTVMPFILRGVTLLGHQLLGHPARAAPRVWQRIADGPEAAAPGAHRHAHHRLRRAACRLPRLPRRGGHRAHRGAHRLNGLNRSYSPVGLRWLRPCGSCRCGIECGSLSRSPYVANSHRRRAPAGRSGCGTPAAGRRHHQRLRGIARAARRLSRASTSPAPGSPMPPSACRTWG